MIVLSGEVVIMYVCVHESVSHSICVHDMLCLCVLFVLSRLRYDIIAFTLWAAYVFKCEL